MDNGNPHPGWSQQYKRDTMEIKYVLDITKPYDNVLMMYGDHYQVQRYTQGIDAVSVDQWELDNPNNGWIPDTTGTNLEGDPDRLYYLHDELGSTTKVIGEDGKTSAHYNYDEFGRPLSFKKFDQNWPGPDNTFGYTGYQYDVYAGLWYAQARYYDPVAGRFISEDSYKGDVTDPLSLNLYSYCLNNPVMLVDPSGNTYLIAWSYGRKDVREYEQYRADNGYSMVIDGDTSDWDDDTWSDFNKRSSFARAAYTKKKTLLDMGVPENDIDVRRIDSEQDLIETWNMWAEYKIIEGLDFYSHGYAEGAEVYGGSGDFWDDANKLNFGSTLRELTINGKKVGYISSPYTAFYGCNTANGDFAQNYANTQGVTTFAQTYYANFSNDLKKRTWIDTHGTSLDVYLISFESFWHLRNNDGLGKRFTPSVK